MARTNPSCGRRADSTAPPPPAQTQDLRPAGNAEDRGVVPLGRERGPSDSLPPTARGILDAARRLVDRSGYQALTFDRIAAESGSNKSMIRYYFGSKDGLVAALVDDLAHDSALGFLELAQQTCGSDTLRKSHQAATREFMFGPSFRSLFDLLPEALHRPALAELVASLYEWYREVEIICFGGDAAEPESDVRALAGLQMAVIDGLALQLALGTDQTDVDASWKLMEDLVTGFLSSRGSADNGKGSRERESPAVPDRDGAELEDDR
jgi:AcrR family transcriptional regulator